MGPETVTNPGREEYAAFGWVCSGPPVIPSASSSKAIPSATLNQTSLLSGFARMNLSTFLLTLPE
jgi:hypothetical protein